MGRLPCRTDSDNNACRGDSRDTVGRDQSLADTLEEWRHRPDLCLMWVAFCAPSTLTLADGVSLAKTRKCSSEVLQLLAGVGLTQSEAEASSQDKEQHWRAPCHKEGDRSTLPMLHDVQPLSVLCTDHSPLLMGSCAVPAELQSHSSSGHFLSHTADAKPCDADLAYFRKCVEVAPKPWVSGDFTLVARLAKSVHGEIRHLTTRDGLHVAAKVAPFVTAEQSMKREESEQCTWFRSEESPNIEDPWNEIAVLTYLQRSCKYCPFLVRLHEAFQDATSLYLLTEYCEGGELFDRVAHGDPIAESEKRRYVSQLLQAVQHLHAHNIGHRDISLENVLLRNGNCVLIDFGQAVRLRGVDGTILRYFAEAGKRMYRAPEMYVPRERPVQVVCPPDALPGSVAQVSYDRCRCEVLLPSDAVPLRPCAAEPHGYAVGPADVFACGVSAFVLLIGKPPWALACDVDPTFSFIRRHGIPNLLHQWRGGGFYRPGTPPSDEESLLAQMLRVNPTQRPSTDECLHSPWLACSE